jgi:hypothetical protein
MWQIYRHAGSGGNGQIAAYEVITMGDTKHQIELELGAALEYAEAATWTTNELVGRTLDTAVSGKEAASTLHHAYSAQVHVARVLDWAREWAHSADRLSSSPSLDDWLSWMRRARNHAERLCRCFPASEKAGDGAASLRNGRRDGRRITWKPRTEQKNP